MLFRSGTTARDKRTLENLKNTIYKVCKKEIIPNPKKIKYSSQIEENIDILEQELINTYEENEQENYRGIPLALEENKISEKLYRWISIKIIDGEEKILETIQQKFNINLEAENIKECTTHIKNNLEKSGITNKNFKDKIVSNIVKNAEKVSQEVCSFEDRDYSGRDRKIDKILTSKKFGIPIMILFLGLIFWLTIVGANYPSELLFNLFN